LSVLINALKMRSYERVETVLASSHAAASSQVAKGAGRCRSRWDQDVIVLNSSEPNPLGLTAEDVESDSTLTQSFVIRRPIACSPVTGRRHRTLGLKRVLEETLHRYCCSVERRPALR
jgi:hypothetical protein